MQPAKLRIKKKFPNSKENVSQIVYWWILILLQIRIIKQIGQYTLSLGTIVTIWIWNHFDTLNHSKKICPRLLIFPCSVKKYVWRILSSSICAVKTQLISQMMRESMGGTKCWKICQLCQNYLSAAKKSFSRSRIKNINIDKTWATKSYTTWYKVNPLNDDENFVYEVLNRNLNQLETCILSIVP